MRLEGVRGPSIEEILENLRVTSRRLKSLGQLHKLTRIILNEPDLNAFLFEICKAGQKLLRVPYVCIFLVDQVDAMKLKIVCWGPLNEDKGEKLKAISNSFTIGKTEIVGRCAQSGMCENVPTVNEDNISKVIFSETKSEFALPLKDGEKLLGVIKFESKNRNHFSDELQGYAADLADRAVIGIRQAQSKERNLKERQLINVMNKVDRCVLDETQDLDNALNIALEGSLSLTDADCGHIQILKKGTNKVVIRALKGELVKGARMEFKIGTHGITGWVAKHKVPFRTGNVHNPKEGDPIYIPTFKGVISELTVPILYSTTYIGNIDLNKRGADWFTKSDEERVCKLADQVSLALLVSTQREKQRFDDKLSAIGDAAAATAHHLKNIVSGQGINIERLEKAIKEERRISDESKSYVLEILSTLHKNNSKLNYTCRKILDSKHRVAAMKPFSLNDFLKNFFAESSIRGKGVGVLEEADQEYEIVSDSQILEEILTNIVSNALDAIKNVKKPRITIEYGECMEEQGRVFIDIRDNGHGMTEDQRSQAFMPFKTSKESGVGFGLGLSIVQSLADKIKANISVDSVKEKGTTFKLVIPSRG